MWSTARCRSQAAGSDYGVVLTPGAGTGSYTIDQRATEALRARLGASRGKARSMIDRGDGFEQMLRGEIKPWVRSA